jgi:hypothetical protein
MGKAKMTRSEKARRAGLDPTVVTGRLRLGWSLKRALSTPVLSMPHYYDEHGQSLFARAKAAGHKNPLNVLKRVRLLGWSHERALSTPSQDMSAPRSQTSHAARERLRAEERKIISEMLMGRPVTAKEAKKLLRDLRLAGVIPRRNASRDGPSLSSRAREAGLPPGLVHLRKQRGWSEERALATPPLR